MDYKFEKGTSNHTFVLFHGTGGSKEDLIPLARMIDEEANILSIEGDVEEAGMKRFFKRIKPGVFDEEDLIERTHSLYDTLNALAKEKGLDRDNFIALGYSNGANIIASTIYHYTKPFKAVFLHHPMMPFENMECHAQHDLPVFIGAGNNDPICPSAQTLRLAKTLNNCEAQVDIHWHDSGHELTQSELDAAKKFYDTLIKKSNE